MEKLCLKIISSWLETVSLKVEMRISFGTIVLLYSIGKARLVQ
jgi:hypothetical protein